MITFADLMLLLLTFFVLLFSMSHVKSQNWQAVVDALSQRLNPESARAEAVLAQSSIQRLADRLVISLPGDLFFDTGSAELTQEARRAALELGELLHYVRNRVEVNGHSDLAPRRGQHVGEPDQFGGRVADVCHGPASAAGGVSLAR